MIALCFSSCFLAAGCYAPIHSPGIKARHLPDSYRWPTRTAGEKLNYASLVAPTYGPYLLGPGDLLEITIPDLIQRGEAKPFSLRVSESGEVFLPRVGPISIGGMTLQQAQIKVNESLQGEFLQAPGTSLTLVEKGTINVLVLGAVQTPGMHALARYENDVAHALAAAGGLSELAGEQIEVHRRGATVPTFTPTMMTTPQIQPIPEQAPLPTPIQPALPQQFLHSQMPPAIPQRQLTQPKLQNITKQPRLTVNSVSTQSSSDHPKPSIRQPRMAPVQQPMMRSGTQYSNPTHLPSSPPLQRHPVAPVAEPAIKNFEKLPQQERPHSIPHHRHEAVFRGQSPEIPLTTHWGINEPFDGHQYFDGVGSITRISLRGEQTFSPQEVVLNPGDVVVVPAKTDDVFYVVGPLSESNRIRFTVGDRDREIGNGLLLPPDREIDVVTAVAMAGYIDPIYSPTTVTVHRTDEAGMPMLIRVNLIKARFDPRETILVQRGDIIYLNPDPWWYSRRLVDILLDSTLGRLIVR